MIPPLAREALERSEVVVGYGLYLRWIAPWLEGKEIHDLPLTKEREHLESEMTEKLETLRRESARQIEECRNKIAQQEEQHKETYRSRMAAESEFDKQKALLEQKLEFLERQLQESQSKEKELSSEVKN